MSRFSGCCVLPYFFFFFSSRRRHTRWPRDWSSDVCSSDLPLRIERIQALLVLRRVRRVDLGQARAEGVGHQRDVRSEERRVGKSVDLGGRRNIKKKKRKKKR